MSNKDDACTLSTITPKLDDVLLSWFYKQKTKSNYYELYIHQPSTCKVQTHNANVSAKNKTKNRLTKIIVSFLSHNSWNIKLKEHKWFPNYWACAKREESNTQYIFNLFDGTLRRENMHENREHPMEYQVQILLWIALWIYWPYYVLVLSLGMCHYMNTIINLFIQSTMPSN